MPLGDSITSGGGSTDQAGYRRLLYDSLLAQGFNVDFVGSLQGGIGDFDSDHEGHGGWRADQIAANVTFFLNSNPADIVLLHIGTNSLTTNAGFVEAILNNIDAVSPDIIVVLARITGVSCCGDVPSCASCATVTQFNDNVQAMAEARIADGDKIILVDMEHALVYPGDLSDAVHPNDSGYSKMAAVWLPAVEQAIGMVKSLTTSQWPAEVEVHGGDDAVFTAAANGALPLHYEWFRNDEPVGTDSDSYKLMGAHSSDDGTRITCRVADYRGEIASAETVVRITYRLTTVIQGSGTVTVDPAGVFYRQGSIVKLTPMAESGWAFSAWGGAAMGDSPLMYVVMVGDRNVTATFVPNPPPPSDGGGDPAAQPASQTEPAATVAQSSASGAAGQGAGGLCGIGAGFTSLSLLLVFVPRKKRGRGACKHSGSSPGA